MVLLLRHNGALAVVPAAVALLVRFRLSAKPQGRWKYGLLALPVALLLLFDGLVVPQIAIPVESSADLLGVAIQQTGRILKNAPQDVSAEEMTVIDRVLEADRLAEAYLPKKSDPVRRLYRYFNGHTRADVLAFAGVAAKLAAAHPLTALHAFWSLNGGYLDPFDVSGARFNIALSDTSPKYPAALVIELPKALTALQDRLLSLEASYAALPLVSQLQSAGLFTWAMLIGWFLIGRTRERGLGWLLLAPLMTLLACLLSAGFSIGSRYALPIVYTAPYLLCVFARPVLRDAAGGGAITEAAGTAAQKVETNE
jgi:hypothetical protein